MIGVGATECLIKDKRWQRLGIATMNNGIEDAALAMIALFYFSL